VRAGWTKRKPNFLGDSIVSFPFVKVEVFLYSLINELKEVTPNQCVMLEELADSCSAVVQGIKWRFTRVGGG